MQHERPPHGGGAEIVDELIVLGRTDQRWKSAQPITALPRHVLVRPASGTIRLAGCGGIARHRERAGYTRSGCPPDRFPLLWPRPRWLPLGSPTLESSLGRPGMSDALPPDPQRTVPEPGRFQQES